MVVPVVLVSRDFDVIRKIIVIVQIIVCRDDIVIGIIIRVQIDVDIIFVLLGLSLRIFLFRQRAFAALETADVIRLGGATFRAHGRDAVQVIEAGAALNARPF
ncbi:hypothetical protein AD946_09395 [Gluconobacter thailandicus]|nr:hypothetical protein AD946_09395 [Gluconobacter thailandicus]